MTVTEQIEPSVRSFRAIGTTATVVVLEKTRANRAAEILRAEIDAIDRACSRFRDDSELEYLHRHAGQVVSVSPLLFEALEVAYEVAQLTRGAVDPTVGAAVIALGYDRDFADLATGPIRNVESPRASAGYRHLHLNPGSREVRIPTGVRLDLGASAKALVADRAAKRIFKALGSGTLVSIGGDVAVAGPTPCGGWPVGIAIDSSTSPESVDQTVAIQGGGLASSSTAVRIWQSNEERVHHIVDPSTGRSSLPFWTLVSVAAVSCVQANAIATAAVVWGAHAVARVASHGVSARLVRHDGKVIALGGWPTT